VSDPFATPPPSLADRRSRSWPGFLAGLAVTVAAVVALVNLWPDDKEPSPVTTQSHFFPDLSSTTTVIGAPGVPATVVPSPTIAPTTTQPTNLFVSGAPEAVGAVLGAAEVQRDNGAVRPVEDLLQLAIYRDYLFVAYVPPASDTTIDRIMWRAGNVGAPEPNPIDDRVDADTQPKLFTPGEIDLDRIPALVADAPSHYDVPVQVTHIIVDRFLPFDQRVLIRVYASPSDGRSGGGYVSYTTDGTFVKVCC
jgi:hypothetical protein